MRSAGNFLRWMQVTATVHCDDLPRLAEFASTDSISTNGLITGQAQPTLQLLQDAVSSATTQLQAASVALGTAQLNQQSALSAQAIGRFWRPHHGLLRFHDKTVLDIQVLNLSLGHPIFEPPATDPLVQAVEHAVRAGLTVVVSAGNFGINRKTGQSGYAGVASPGNAPSAITVGAVRTFDTIARGDDRIAAYSSRGPTWYDGFAKPDVSAPGYNLLSVAAAGSTLRLPEPLISPAPCVSASVVDFAFDVIGVHRLEARAAVANGRGNGALRKVGAGSSVT